MGMDPVKLPPARPLTLINSKVDGGRGVRSIPLLKGKNTMKTIIFYTRKGARKAKQQGLATAPGSAVTIRTCVRWRSAAMGGSTS